MGFDSQTAKKAGAKSNRQGVPNKITGNVREMLSSFIQEKFESVMKDFDNLEPKDKIEVLVKLLPYVAPRMQSLQLQSEFDMLSDADLDRIISELKNNHHEPTGKN